MKDTAIASSPLASPEVPITHRGIVTRKNLPIEYGISYQTAWRLGKDDPEFPSRVYLVGENVGYFRHELDQYFLNRPRAVQKAQVARAKIYAAHECVV